MALPLPYVLQQKKEGRPPFVLRGKEEKFSHQIYCTIGGGEEKFSLRE